MYNKDLSRLLERKFDLQDFSAIPDFPFCKYFDENSLESLLIKWNQSVVSEALAKAQAGLSDDQESIYMVRGGQAQPPFRNWKPDWACVRRSASAPLEKTKNLLPGDTKLSQKWSSAVIEKAGGKIDKMSINDVKPLNQIYSYLINNGTRYGFIITDAELFVVRVRLEQYNSFNSGNRDSKDSLPKRAQEAGVLDYKVIPWTAGVDNESQTSNVLTVNLALFWLHILATGHIHIGDKENYGLLRDAVWNPAADNDAPSRGYAAVGPVSHFPSLLDLASVEGNGLTHCVGAHLAEKVAQAPKQAPLEVESEKQDQLRARAHRQRRHPQKGQVPRLEEL